ncbi:MAG TPA: prolipoprotein diacylglyceryl transferase family protein [Polyangiaceae bacterium]|nr:prolipoprotein diacylglyceryl transferase family protein [Polyangiaceae bacterium]
MSGPLIPYIKIPEIPLPFPKPVDSIKPFGVLVATGVYLGAHVAVKHARQRGLDVNKMNSFILWVVGLGFVGAHVFDAVFYTPDRIARDPLYLLQIWAGLSSYGGFFGAIFGALAFRYVKKEKVLPLVDTVCSAFPLAWVFGRAGCASVHDHPGRETTSWLGVQYFHPDVRNPEKWGLLFDSMQTKGRFDLGFIEFALTIPLAVTFAVLWAKRPRGYGFWAGWQCIFYAPVRFFLDFLRVEAPGGGIHEADLRYAGLTPAQWACFVLAGIGALMVWYSKREPAPASWSDVQPWVDEDERDRDADDDEDEDDDARPIVKKRAPSKDAAKGTKSAKSSAKSSDVPGATKKKKAKPVADSPKKTAKPEPESSDADEEDAGEDASTGDAPKADVASKSDSSKSDDASKRGGAAAEEET